MLTRSALQQRQPRADDLLAVPANLRFLAWSQAGVLRRAQMYRVGLTPSVIDAQVRAHRWRAIGKNVVVLGNAPLTQVQRRWVATLLVSKPVALAGPTAADCAGLTGFRSDSVHILVPHDTHTALPRWIKVHESRRFTQGDIRRGSGPPTTTTARAVLDTACWSTSPRRACAVLCAGVQQRLLTAEHLETELRVAGHVKHAAIMRAILGDIGGGGHTLAEIDLGPIAARAGLPRPRRQALRREASGRWRYVDAEFDLPDGVVLVVEIDGAVHLQPSSYWDDMDRQNEIVIDGSPVLRFTSLGVRLSEQRVIDQLRRMRCAHTRGA